MTTELARLTRTEIRKVTSVRSSIAFPIAAVSFAVLSFAPVLTMTAAERRAFGDDAIVSAMRGPGLVVAVLMLLLWALATGGEHRNGTMTATLLVAPDRRRVAMAKLGAAAVVAAVTAIVAEAVTLLLGGVFVAANDISSTASVGDIVAVAAAVVTVSVLYALAGVGLGAAFRNPTAAVGTALAWLGMVEGVIPVVLRTPWLFKWLPSGAANAVLGVVDPPPDLLPPLAGGALLLLTVAVLAAAGSAVLVRRDVEITP